MAARRTGRLLAGATQARDAIDRISYFVIIAMVGLMTTLIAVQVALRYIFNGSIDWADEVSRLSFVWLVFLAVPHGVKAGIHVGLDMLPKLLPERWQLALSWFNRFALAGFLCVAGWQATLLTIRNWENTMPTIALSAGLFFLALALCCVHSLLHVFSPPPPGKAANAVDVL